MKLQVMLAILFCFGSTVTVVKQKIVLVGGTSEIGQELARLLLTKGHMVVVVDDEVDLLLDMQEREGQKLITKLLPINDIEESRKTFTDIITELNGLDICILCNSIAPEIEEYGLLQNNKIPWKATKDTIDLNVTGFTGLANIALNYFIKQRRGYLVGISSLDALYGHPGCPCYTASKAFMSNYLSAMRQKCERLLLKDITICDIRWSYVSQVKDSLEAGWTEDPQIAAMQMLRAIEERKPVTYIMSRWSFVLWALAAVPTLLRDAVAGVSSLRFASSVKSYEQQS
jgi:short-subunit dehydrogenase